MDLELGLERKFSHFGKSLKINEGAEIEGYASLFGERDQGGDIVKPGAYAKSIEELKKSGRSVKMLWQHDPQEPIGVWEEVREDSKGLWVKGRILDTLQRGREAISLIAAGAIEGLSIGYRTKTATRNEKGQRLLSELELWEVSLVTFPMLPSARVRAKGDTHANDDQLREVAVAFEEARKELERR